MKREFIELTKLHQVTCEVTGVNYDLTFEKKRHGELKEARQITMYLAAKGKIIPYLSLSKIGEFFGKYYHATVIHACRTIQNMIDTNAEMRCGLKFSNATILIKEIYVKPETFDYVLPSKDHLLRFRTERNLSIYDIEKLSGVPKTTIRRIEKGGQYLVSNLVKLCDCYNEISLKETQRI